MVDTVENAAFCLPTHFLTDDDLLSNNISPIRRRQPHPFSIHTDKDDNNDDDDNEELLAELTRYLTHSSFNQSEKRWGYSTSPQSTLTGFGPWWSNRSGFSSNGSPTGPYRFPSPLLTPDNENTTAVELLYEAAAYVARLNNTSTTIGLPRHHLSSLYSHPPVRRHESSVCQQGRGERSDCYCHYHHHHNHQQIHPLQHRSYGGVSGWGPQRGRQQQSQGMTAVFLGGGVKKLSSGTGVFIPRRADSGTHHNQADISTATTRKKGSGCSTVLLPTRVVQALNLDVNGMKNGGANYNNTSNGIQTDDHETLMGGRNAPISMQRRNGREGATVVGHQETGLPTDWIY